MAVKWCFRSATAVCVMLHCAFKPVSAWYTCFSEHDSTLSTGNLHSRCWSQPVNSLQWKTALKIVLWWSTVRVNFFKYNLFYKILDNQKLAKLDKLEVFFFFFAITESAVANCWCKPKECSSHSTLTLLTIAVKVRDWLAWREILGVVGLFRAKHRPSNPEAAIISNPLFACCPWLTKKHNANRGQFVLMNKGNVERKYLVSTKLEPRENLSVGQQRMWRHAVQGKLLSKYLNKDTQKELSLTPEEHSSKESCVYRFLSDHPYNKVSMLNFFF